MNLRRITFEQSGMASIPTVMALAILILLIGVLITTTSINETTSVGSSADSTKTLNYAQAGALDALERIARNKNYTGVYSMDMVANGCTVNFSGCANVTVSASSSPKSIISVGQITTVQRKIQVDVNLDANGLITNYNWQEF